MTIDDFCDELLRDDCPEGRLEPERLAAEFTRRFQVPLRVSLDDLAVLLESAGIGPVYGAPLADGLRGVHYSLSGGGYAIQYLENQWEGGKVHTVLHETAEIVHEQVWDRRHGIKPPGEICPEADRFAAAVMMPPDVFAAYAQASGLDVLALQRLFRCAYSSVTRRLGEVMRRQPLAAVLYERGREGPAAWPERAGSTAFRAAALTRTPGFGERASRLLCGSRGRMPLPERPPPSGSLAQEVINTGRAEYAEADGVAVVAAPVFWNGKLAKVIVVAVPWEHRSVLEPQLGRRGWPYRRDRLGAVPGLAVR